MEYSEQGNRKLYCSVKVINDAPFEMKMVNKPIIHLML